MMKISESSRAECGQRLLRATLALAAAALLLSADTGAAEDLQRQIVATLGADLLHAGSLDAHQLQRDLAAANDIGAEEIRAQLLALLDLVEWHRKHKTDAWKAAVRLGGEEVEPKRAEKLFRELRKVSNKVLKKNEKRPVELVLEDGARKAGVRLYRARKLLLLAFAAEIDSASAFLGFPDQLGLFVEVAEWSGYQSSKGEFRLQTNIPGGISTQSSIARNMIERDLVLFLTREMEASKHVKWALSKPVPRLPTDFRLLFGLRRFEVSEGTTDPSRRLPYVTLAAVVMLEHIPTGTSLFTEEMEYAYDFSRERDATTQALLRLDKFYAKVGRETRGAVERYLAE